MRFFIGGYGIQGLIAIPLIEALNDLGFEGNLVVNGIGGFYAVVRDVLGKDEALSRVFELVDRIDYELFMIERRWICEGRRIEGWKKIAVEHCTRLALEESFVSWEDISDLLDGLDKSTNVGAEYLDMDGNIGIDRGDGLSVAKTSLAITGIFPANDGKLSTTHFTQIPVYTAEDGDAILVNFRDLSKCAFEKADEIISQSAEIRSIVFAKKLLSEKNLLEIHVPPISYGDLSRLPYMKDEFVEKLEGYL